MKKLLLSLFLCFLIFPLCAEITARYEATSPLVWTNNEPGNPSFQNKLVTKIGTMTIDVPKEDDFSSLMLSGLTPYSYCKITAKHAWNDVETTTAQTYLVLKVDGSIVLTQLVWTNQNPNDIINLYKLNQGNHDHVLTLDYYIVSDNSAGWFAEDTTITIDTNLSLGKLVITRRPNESIYDANNRVPINIVSGGYDPTHFQFIGSGNYNTDNTVNSTRGNPADAPTTALFEVLNNPDSIPLVDMEGNNKTKAADLSVTVSGKKKKYNLSLTFSDGNSDSAFVLANETNANERLPFNLYLGSDQLTEGVAYLGWKNLPNGTEQIKSLYVGGIDQNSANALLAGTYKDTISITLQVL